MKKKLVFLVLLVIVSVSSTVYAADGVTVMVNGKQVVSDTPAVITDSGSTMLPFRAIFNSLGVNDDEIKWNSQSKSIEVNSGGNYIFLVIGNSGALVNDKLITLNAAPYIESGKTMVPVRFISESLGAGVQWDKETKTVKISK